MRLMMMIMMDKNFILDINTSILDETKSSLSFVNHFQANLFYHHLDNVLVMKFLDNFDGISSFRLNKCKPN